MNKFYGTNVSNTQQWRMKKALFSCLAFCNDQEMFSSYDKGKELGESLI